MNAIHHKRNVQTILQMAAEISEKDKREALERGDHETAIRIASNEGEFQAFFEKKYGGVPDTFIVKPDGTVLV